jgi:hypothetical protein
LALGSRNRDHYERFGFSQILRRNAEIKVGEAFLIEFLVQQAPLIALFDFFL